MKYSVLNTGEMRSQIETKILQSEREHYSLLLQLPEAENSLPLSAGKLLGILLRMKKLEKTIDTEKEKLSTLNGIQ